LLDGAGIVGASLQREGQLEAHPGIVGRERGGALEQRHRSFRVGHQSRSGARGFPPGGFVRREARGALGQAACFLELPGVDAEEGQVAVRGSFRRRQRHGAPQRFLGLAKPSGAAQQVAEVSQRAHGVRVCRERHAIGPLRERGVAVLLEHHAEVEGGFPVVGLQGECGGEGVAAASRSPVAFSASASPWRSDALEGCRLTSFSKAARASAGRCAPSRACASRSSSSGDCAID
jgi:hypothetical protein